MSPIPKSVVKKTIPKNLKESFETNKSPKIIAGKTIAEPKSGCKKISPNEMQLMI